MRAFYNEIDPFCCAWLSNLMDAGHITPGVICDRSIADVRPDEVAGFTRAHFFAGIAIWDHVLTTAGWGDKPVWTGSCPCQPFSAAGKGLGFADERHLWPAFHHLIRECRPPVVIGEQVGGSRADGWVDLVQADLEAEGYAFGIVETCAAGFGEEGVGGFHIRQRNYWLARLENAELSSGKRLGEHSRENIRQQETAGLAGTGSASRLADALTPERSGGLGTERHEHDARGRKQGSAKAAGLRRSGGVADTDGRNPGAERQQPSGQHGQQQENDGAVPADRSVPAHGLGRDVDWLLCRDAKWRPVESGTFPLVDAYPQRVGVLRAAGNALDAAQAKGFCEAVLACIP